MTNDALRVRDCTSFGREKSCGVHMIRVWEGGGEMGGIRPMRRMVAREKARISADISRFDVQRRPCLRLFTPYYGFAGDPQRREEAKEGGWLKKSGVRSQESAKCEARSIEAAGTKPVGTQEIRKRKEDGGWKMEDGGKCKIPKTFNIQCRAFKGAGTARCGERAPPECG